MKIDGEWFRVAKINKKTVEIVSPRWKKRNLDTVTEVMSKADFEAKFGAPEATEPEPLIEPKETISKAEWEKYRYWKQAYTKGGCRHIIRKHEHLPVLVDGMPKPARKGGSA